jgi:hypothetical protein
MFAARRVGAVLLAGVAVAGLASCRSSANFLMAGGTYVLLAQPDDDSDAGDDEAISGTVTVIGSCLGIDDAIAVWPADTTVVGTNPVVIKVPDVGEIGVGDAIDGAGGTFTTSDPPEGVVVPDDCDAARMVSFRGS